MAAAAVLCAHSHAGLRDRYTGQTMASAMKAKIREAPPTENRTWSDINAPPVA